MKHIDNIKHFLVAAIMPVVGIGLVSSCNDFLEVDAPSSATPEFVFRQKTEVERALNGLYAQTLVDDLYGKAYQSTFVLNTDVETKIYSDGQHEHNSYARYDCDQQGNELYKYWTASYNVIEYCNRFITSLQESSIYNENDAEIMQYIGEAKCLRAMVYHDLVVMFGDVPFTFIPSAVRGSGTIPVKNREEIQNAIINDLKGIAPYMSSTKTTTVERCSKEYAQSLIARIALTAGGYSLRPDTSSVGNGYGQMQRPENYKEYYKIAMDYADSVITAGTHRLSQTYQSVFVNECNYRVVNDDDVIYEIPFAKESTGNVGYIQGPTYSAYEGETVGPWGACDGGTRLNAFYRFQFKDKDMRREFVNGLWYYGYVTNVDGTLTDTVYIRNDYTVHNNKWSKLWTDKTQALGKDKSGSTGINYPYMRYADVLLMYAEAANELNDGPTEKAKDCFMQVHSRAFIDGDLSYLDVTNGDKNAFHKAVMNERKWEFAGENMRWRDLVRTNTLAEELVYSFLRYYSVGMQSVGSGCGYEDAINEHDGLNYIDNLPTRIYFHKYFSKDVTESGKARVTSQFYGNTLVQTGVNEAGAKIYDFYEKYPNQELPSLRIYNPYKKISGTAPSSNEVKKAFAEVDGKPYAIFSFADFYNWGDENSGTPKDQCKYSYYGYVRSDANGNMYIIKDGAATMFPSTIDASQLPAVRYILPYPNLAIQRSKGQYKNYYGYTN